MSGWFRMYDEALDDPKVQRLPVEDFKFWVNSLMLANRHGGILPAIGDLVFAFRMDEIAVVSTLDRLVIAGLFDVLKGGANGRRIAPHGWEKRQYKSDTSTDRVKRFRDRVETVPETPLRARSESDQSRTEKKEDKPAAVAASLFELPSPEKRVYDYGKTILGKSAGGQITKLMKHFGGDPDRTMVCLKTAAGKNSPAEYIGGVLRGNGAETTDDIIAETTKMYEEWGVDL